MNVLDSGDGFLAAFVAVVGLAIDDFGCPASVPGPHLPYGLRLSEPRIDSCSHPIKTDTALFQLSYPSCRSLVLVRIGVRVQGYAIV
jgi:hypothetical protein